MLSCQREHFSVPEGVHYLNCAYMSPLPRRVEAAGIAALRRKQTPWTITPDDFFDGLDALRRRFAALIGAADPRRIAVIPSVSYGVAAAARNTPVARGQTIVVLGQQFPSNVYGWRRLARSTGAEIRTVPPPERRPGRGAEWNARLLDAVDATTAIVALGQVHWADGTVFDLEAVSRRVRDVGAALVVDGTQSVGAVPLNVESLQPDAVICAGYKWLLGPYGLGLAYFGPRYDGGVPLEETWLARPGSEKFQGLVEYRDEYRDGAARYDMGEASSFALVPMLVAALEQLGEWSVPAIGEYCGRLTGTLAREAVALGFDVEEGPWQAPHILGLGMPSTVDPDAVRQALLTRGVHVSARADVLRVSPHVYNARADVEALLEGLGAVTAGALA